MLTALLETGLMGLVCAFTRWWTARFNCILATEPERPWRVGKEAEVSDFGSGSTVPLLNVAFGHYHPDNTMISTRRLLPTADRRGPGGFTSSTWVPRTRAAGTRTGIPGEHGRRGGSAVGAGPGLNCCRQREG